MFEQKALINYIMNYKYDIFEKYIYNIRPIIFILNLYVLV